MIKLRLKKEIFPLEPIYMAIPPWGLLVNLNTYIGIIGIAIQITGAYLLSTNQNIDIY
jgi:hypothetical protein